MLSLAGRRHVDSRQIGDDAPETILEFAKKNFSLEADGMFLSRTNWRAMVLADQLDKEISRPVVTSNQATIWATFRSLRLNTQIKGYGSLLASPGVLASI